jgi:hypothetical protein
MERFTTGGEGHAHSPTPGPVAELQAHVAILPMLRIGPYVAHDISPVSGAPARQISEAGVRAKLSPPILALPWRTWAFIGAGYARTYQPSHEVSGSTVLFVPGAGGGLFDTRVGLGLGYRLAKPWEIFAELGARFGLVFAGSMYGGACGCGAPYTGKDSFALSLSVGLSLNQ